MNYTAQIWNDHKVPRLRNTDIDSIIYIKHLKGNPHIHDIPITKIHYVSGQILRQQVFGHF